MFIILRFIPFLIHYVQYIRFHTFLIHYVHHITFHTFFFNSICSSYQVSYFFKFIMFIISFFVLFFNSLGCSKLIVIKIYSESDNQRVTFFLIFDMFHANSSCIDIKPSAPYTRSRFQWHLSSNFIALVYIIDYQSTSSQT